MRFDPLIVHYLARELHERLAGAGARAVRLDPGAGLAALETRAGALLLDLHPARGRILLTAAPAAPTVIPLPSRSVVRRILEPADERLLVIELTGGGPTRPHRLVVELMTNQWNVLVLAGDPSGDGGGRILAVLRPRDAGGRRLRPGIVYQPPPFSARWGVEEPLPEETWRELLGPVAPAERGSALIAHVAWTSPLNAGWILGRASETESPDALGDAWARYRGLAARPSSAPCVLETTRGRQPYPLLLPGVPSTDTGSLLDAMAQAFGIAGPSATTRAGPEGQPAGHVDPELVERLRRREAALGTRIRRLETQAAGAAQESEDLRAQGDLLLAHLHEVRKGMERVSLPDFAGGEREVTLDPALTPAENAQRLYETARRRAHAAARVPGLVATAEQERTRLGEALARAESGETPDPGELDALLGTPRGQGARSPEERLPYRRYHTSGGLEVRVGRSRRDNDELTFRSSAPDDIWLHARDAGGAHVVLRWADPHAGPPQRDLAEAAVLAALHSRARTSGVVAVDWTRRKYVRKPRKAPPGLVVPERVKTLFVEPDEELERRLRA